MLIDLWPHDEDGVDNAVRCIYVATIFFRFRLLLENAFEALVGFLRQLLLQVFSYFVVIQPQVTASHYLL